LLHEAQRIHGRTGHEPPCPEKKKEEKNEKESRKRKARPSLFLLLLHEDPIFNLRTSIRRHV